MAKNKQKARLVYYKNLADYSQGNYKPGEAYVLELLDNGSWVFSEAWRLQQGISCEKNDFVHFSIITKMRDIISWGYELNYLGINIRLDSIDRSK